MSDRRALLRHIERKNNFTFRLFQIDHLSRLLIRERGMLAFEQGLGKTLCLLALAEAHRYLGAAPYALFVSPQDLGAQWAREAKRFFNRRLEVIRTPAEARRVADRVHASLAMDKWELLKDKGGASDLAFDGELSVQPEEAIDWNEVLRNMKARGIQAAGNEVPETEVEAAWREVAPLRPTVAPRKIRPRPPGSSGLLSGPQPVYGQPSLFDLSA